MRGKWIYKINNREESGINLWDAIISKCNRYNHPFIDEWIDGQAEGYLEEEYDNERMYYVFWKLKSLRLIDIFRFEKIDIENEIDFINRTELNKLIEKYKSNEQVYLKLLELKQVFEKDLEYERLESAYNLASEDFDMFIEDINKDDDIEVAEFFGFEFDIIGFEDELGIEHSMEDIFICPYCDEPNLFEELEQNYDKHSDDKFETIIAYCVNGCNEKFSHPDFMMKNKHLDETKIIVRMV